MAALKTPTATAKKARDVIGRGKTRVIETGEKNRGEKRVKGWGKGYT